MGFQLAVPTAEARVKLKDLYTQYRKQGFHAEEEERHLWAFGAYLADVLPSDIASWEFYDFVMSRAVDVKNGFCRITGQPIGGYLQDLGMVAVILGAEAPRIAQAVFPEEFARSVLEAQHELTRYLNERSI